jgi:sugar (pentulose or hexulose) kinase
MPVTIGIDAGTTTITALALDADGGQVLALATARNDAEITPAADRARGRSEWDAGAIFATVLHALAEIAAQLGGGCDIAGIGFTGQQHGVVIVDDWLSPVTPLINWQDRRGDDLIPGENCTWVERARALLGPDAPERNGCALATGFLGATLFWMNETGCLPPSGAACFITDYLAAALTGKKPVTDPTMGASSGLLDIRNRRWDEAGIAALSLPRRLFPEIREAGDRLGGLSLDVAAATGLPAGLPVFVGLGDNQASFLGSVASPVETVLVNVGTGAQVSRYTHRYCYSPPLETRPFPREGYLLVEPGLCGGRAYAILERFFRDVARDVLDLAATESLYDRMNALAATAQSGCDGLRCEPLFTGTRADPDRRAAFTGASAENLTPANMVRSLLEGIARSFAEGRDMIDAAIGSPSTRLVGTGNGLRENPVLSRIVADEFALPMAIPTHREEAAYGAALAAAFGADLWPSLAEASGVIRYE